MPGKTVAVKVVAALIYEGARLLACQRREGGSHPLKWEFPGGKVEEGEDCLAALKRELAEELGIEVQSASEVARYRYVYPARFEVELYFFRVEQYGGVASNRAFQRLARVEVDRLKELDFLEGDLPLIEKLIRGDIRL